MPSMSWARARMSARISIVASTGCDASLAGAPAPGMASASAGAGGSGAAGPFSPRGSDSGFSDVAGERFQPLGGTRATPRSPSLQRSGTGALASRSLETARAPAACGSVAGAARKPVIGRAASADTPRTKAVRSAIPWRRGLPTAGKNGAGKESVRAWLRPARARPAPGAEDEVVHDLDTEETPGGHGVRGRTPVVRRRRRVSRGMVVREDDPGGVPADRLREELADAHRRARDVPAVQRDDGDEPVRAAEERDDQRLTLEVREVGRERSRRELRRVAALARRRIGDDTASELACREDPRRRRDADAGRPHAHGVGAREAARPAEGARQGLRDVQRGPHSRARADEDREELGVGEGTGAARQEPFARARRFGPLTDRHIRDIGTRVLAANALCFARLAARVHRPVALVEVLRAERADVPLRPDELPAVRAHPLEPGATRGAQDEIVLDAFLAGGTDHARLRLGEQALCGELALVGLAEGFLGSDDQIEEEAEDVEEHDHEASEVGKDLVLGPLLRVTDGPEDHREVEREDVQPREPDRELDERVVDERDRKSVV